MSCGPARVGPSSSVPENRFVGEVARTYDQPGTGMFAGDVLEATVDCLVELTGGGAAMEFAIGTGRVAVPLAARGVPVTGIELSADMLAVLRSKPEASDITAVEGDMAVTFVEGEFSLVYLVFNTITNLTSQDEQVACFENAARHLRPGGRFVIENGVPGLRQITARQRRCPIRIDGGLHRHRRLHRPHAQADLPVSALLPTWRWQLPRIHGTVPICVAGRAGPDGSDRGDDPGTSMGVVGPLAVHW